MRLLALLPALCCTAALILSFLCLFAGHKKGFMEDYHILTLNTSLLGETLLTEDRTSTNPVLDLLNTIPNEISSSINDRIGEATARLGIQDWYSAHMLNYCEGQYTPEETANATLPQDAISKNVTQCSKRRAMYKFNPTAILEDALNSTGVDITLQDLNWPSDIDSGIAALNTVMAAMFVLYCVAIAFIFLCLVASIAAIVLTGKLTTCVNFLLGVLAFLAIALASALVTAVGVKGSQLVNQHGADVGLQAKWGGKFLAITWAATALMLVTLVVWIVDLCVGRRRKGANYPKNG